MYIDEAEVMNVNLGAPYEQIIENAIQLGYAGNQTEVIRQALMAYRKQFEEEEEVRLVHKGVEIEMQKVRESKIKMVDWDTIKHKYEK